MFAARHEPTTLFVYGTLRPGEVRWPHLRPFVVDEGWPDQVAGLLYDTGQGYPAARFAPGHAGLVIGQSFRLLEHSLAEALALLDRIEGAVVGLYHRVVVTTARGTVAWAYEYGGSLQLEPIPSGDWLARR